MLPDGQEIKCLQEDAVTSLKNKLKISVCVYENKFDREAVYKWFTDFCFFKPCRMEISKNGQYSSKRYNESVFKEAAFDKKVKTLRLEDRKWGSIEFETDGFTAEFSAGIPLNLWTEEKAEIIEKYQEIFMELGGCFGYVVNSFDDVIIQNPRDAGVYKRLKLGDSDFPGIDKIPTIRIDRSTPYPLYQIDPTYLPGHRERYGKMAFTVAPYMWFGPDFSRFFSQEKLANFSSCQENNEFAVGYRRICLWDDVAEYNAELYRERQWSFLKETKMREIVKELRSKPYDIKSADYAADPSVEIERGSFSHGGTILVKFYVDKKGKACTKSSAYAYIQREMDGNTIKCQEKIKL